MNHEPILKAIKQAVKLCRTVQRDYLQSNTKVSGEKGGETEPVTIADYGSQALICRTIQQHFPDDAVLSEESSEQFLKLVQGDQHTHILKLLTDILGETVTEEQVIEWLDYGKNRTAKRTWVIDPIDGTKGFVGMRHYAVAVGVVEEGIASGGFMGCPGYGGGDSQDEANGVIFFVQDGKAVQMPLAGDTIEPIEISNRAEATALQIVQSYEKQHSSRERMTKIRQYAGIDGANISDLDSMEKYALVACGDADLYMRMPRLGSNRPHMSWDHAAGVAIVHAAGGKATDIDGTPLDFSQGKVLPNRGMIVSNGHIHDQVVAAVRKLLEEEANQS